MVDAQPPVTGPDGSALSRATSAMREQPDDAWPGLADDLLRRLRSVTRPGRTVLVDTAGHGDLRINDRVLVDALRRAITRVDGCRVVDIRTVVQRELLDEVLLAIAVEYGRDVRVVADRARGVTAATLHDLGTAACPVQVAVVDVIAAA